MDNEVVVLQPVIERADGFMNTRLHSLEVISAPPHVCLHVLEASVGEGIRYDRCSKVLMELVTNGYQVTIMPRRVELLSALEYEATSHE